MFSVYQMMSQLQKMGYDRYRLDGNPLEGNIICYLFRLNKTEHTIEAGGRCGLEAMTTAVRLARIKAFSEKKMYCDAIRIDDEHN